MSLAAATALMRGLAAGGVRDVVVCPGSRSAPLAAAAARDADLRVHSVIDERSAGFFAVGLGRAAGRPAAVVCTSGSAGAHLYPAVIEASMAEVPLIAITADRPAELHHCGSPQTIDQQKLYGHFTRAALTLDAGASPRSLRAASAMAAHAAATAAGPIPGPVHINAPTRKPLLAADGRDVRSMAPSVAAVEAPRLRCSPVILDDLIARLEAARRPLLCAGPAPRNAARYRAALHDAAAAQSIPLLAEATSQLRLAAVPDGTPAVDHFADLLLDPLPDGLRPDLIIQIGLPTAAGLQRLCGAGIDRVVLAPHRYADPTGDAVAVVIGDVDDAVRAIAAARPTHANSRRAMVAAWREADEAAARAAAPELDGPMSGQAATAAAVGALPAGAALVVGNSLAVRWLDQAIAPGAADLEVFCQRGASGIDGLIAGAAGVAAAGDRPVCLLLGDVSFGHDVGSLAVAADLGRPLAIVALDNGGGRIFDELPYAGALSDGERELFITPSRIDIAAIAAAYGLAAVAVDGPGDLSAAVRDAGERAGATAIHARLAPRSRPALHAPPT